MTAGIKGRTRRKVFDYIRLNGSVSKNEIAEGLDLSLPTVQKYLAHFIDESLIVKGGTFPSSGGRSPRAYNVNRNGRFAVGVDITQDGVTSVVLNLDREVIHAAAIEAYFERSEAYLAMVGRHVEETISRSGVDRSRVLGVGLAMPGLVSEQTSVVIHGRVIDNAGMSSADFGRHLTLPVRLVHDVDAAGLAEFWTQPSFSNAIYLNISKSLGGSVFINGAIYRGDGEFSGEVGHILLHPDGLTCYCGQRGCVDPYCNTGVLSWHTGGSLAAFFAALGEGEPKIVDIWNEYHRNLARALHNVRVLFGCTIIIGGELGTHVRPHLDEIRREVDSLTFNSEDAEDFLVASEYTNEPVATGAALYFIEDFFFSLGDESGTRRSALV